MVAAGREDRELDSGAERCEPDDDEVVRVGIGQAAEDPARRQRRLVEEVEVDPPQRGGDQKARRRGAGRACHPAHAGDSEHDSEYRLAEDDQREQSEALGQMPRMNRSVAQQAPGGNGRDELDRQGGPPQEVRPRTVERNRGDPDQQRETERGQQHPREPPRFGHMPAGTGVQHE